MTPDAQATSRKAADMVERMRAVASGSTRAATAAPAVPTTPAAARRGPRAQRVRYTLDLSPEQHRYLKRAALDLQADASAVLRALLTELEGDAELRARVAANVERRY